MKLNDFKYSKVRNLIFIGIFMLITMQSCKEDEVIDPSFIDIEGINNNISVDWTNLYLSLERYSSGRPNASARGAAYIYLAAYETLVPALDSYRSLTQDLNGLSIDSSQRASNVDYELALNETFAIVLEHFLLNLDTEYVDEIKIFKIQMEDRLSTTLSDEVIAESKIWGAHVATSVINYSKTDIAAETQITDPQPRSYEPPTSEGYWTYTVDQERALFPYWSSVRTFIVGTSETHSVEPIEYSTSWNSAFFAQMQEVYKLNNEAKTSDNEQLWIAEFWSDDVEGLMLSPPARQVSIANQLVDQHELKLAETLALMVKLGFSLNDAAVSTWKYKYEYMVMRPNIYIHEHIDPDFQTNLFRLVFWPNPSFPSYPSGHSTFASAASGVLIDVFGNDVEFTDQTHEGRTEFQGKPRSFTTLDEMAKENAYSRIPLGVHIRMDCDEGLRLGYEIADKINALDQTN